MAEILIVDDERLIRDGMKALFAGEGYSVRTARDGEDALKKIAERRPDLVLLDVMMPKMNGFRTCEAIRRLDGRQPIVFLTAKDAETDEVRGIGLGADDFISKSADETVLLARVRRALERVASLAPSVSSPRTLRLGAVIVDLDRHTVLADGRESSLTSSEFELLRCLASRRGELFSNDDIFSFLRGEGYVGDPTAIRVHVMNLRRKLGKAGDLIVNVPNAGYYLIR